jgi:outer membrane receptor protein involved in Fe transport
MRVRIIAAAFSALLVFAGGVANAQQAAPETQPAAPADPTDAKTVEEIIVTGSRFVKQDFESNSPVFTLDSTDIAERADITIDTYLNTLPQVSPAGTTTSNNPGNSGQSNVNLRGLGANRNLVLIDGRRAMVSASDMTVDLNTIPAALIESIEILSGGAGATYGADAVAGAVNVKLKKNFEGIDLDYQYSNSLGPWDSEEYSASGVAGMNFNQERGNIAVAFDYSNREPMIKSQRNFSSVATATTSFLPEGLYFPSSNAPTQAAVDGVFGTYGVAAGAVPAGSTLIGFNLDGTLFSRGVFNNALNVQNFRYPNDVSVNSRLFPDVYSYNFDSVNILRLPLERKSAMGKLNYQFSDYVEVFGSVSWTRYDSASALAPTPVSTVTTRAPGVATALQATSGLVCSVAIAGQCSGAGSIANLLIVPTTNPFIPANFATVLASRTGNNGNLIGSGATEPFLMRHRTLSAGLRQTGFDNTVLSVVGGLRGDLPMPIGENWRYDVYYTWGKTEIDENQAGNIDTNRLQALLEAADGGVSQCAGGYNPFGRQGLSPECIDYLEVSNTVGNVFRQHIVSAYITGDVFELPAGPLGVVFGAEWRDFKYGLDPGSAGGPISGFNTQSPAGGTNSFKDVFAELNVPIIADQRFIETLEMRLGYRFSISQFEDTVQSLKSDKSKDHTYAIEIGYVPIEALRLSFSWQRAVRAPNFDELFDGGGSNPQYFDPCSATTNARNGPNGAAVTGLCTATGVAGVATYVQTPGTQVSLETTGNIDLKPEKAKTYTLSATFTSPWDGLLERLQAQVAYFSIDIKDPILDPSPSVYVAACYNYYGTNPTYSAADPNCAALLRFGGDILAVLDPNDPSGEGLYPGVNGGRIISKGMDWTVRWGMEAGPGDLDLMMIFSHLIEAKRQERSGLPTLSYKGTATYFGEDLGTTAPDNKIYLIARYDLGEFAFDLRGRWIDRMQNRTSIQFPGEDFSGIPAKDYWDVGVTWNIGERLSHIGAARFHVGINNLFDVKPPQYAPNVQSGTDPSVYDVLGRTIFFQVGTSF